MATIRTNFEPLPTNAASTLRAWAAHLGRIINRWIARWIARREREAARFVLRNLDDRELKDIGIRRSQIRDAVAEIASQRARLQRRAQSRS